MKVKAINDELKQLGVKELLVKLDGYRREEFGLTLNSSTSHIKDYSQFNKARKNIARVLGCLRLKGIKC